MNRTAMRNIAVRFNFLTHLGWKVYDEPLHQSAALNGSRQSAAAGGRDVPNATEDELNRATGHMRSRTFSPGVTLFHQGMPGSSQYVIEKGSVRVFAVGLTGQEHTFTTFGSGSFFGELSMIDGLPRTASAITLDHSVIWLMPREAFNGLLDECQAFCREVVEVLARRTRPARLFRRFFRLPTFQCSSRRGVLKSC